MPNNQLQTTGLNVSLFDDGTLTFSLAGTSQVAGNVTLEIELLASSKQVYQSTLDPCIVNSPEFCPLDEGSIHSTIDLEIPRNVISDEIFTTEMPDVEFRFQVDNSATSEQVGCVMAMLSSGGGEEGDSGSGAMNMDNSTTSNTEGSSGEGGDSNSSNVTDEDSSGGNEGGSGSSFSYSSWTLLMYVLRSQCHRTHANTLFYVDPPLQY